MATAPLITFKAGRCDVDGRKVKPLPTPGFLYLFPEDDLMHLCWRPRNVPSTDPEIDLLTIPSDASFRPYVKDHGADEVRSPTSGRIFCLAFSSSGEKQYFWMQSKTQHRGGDLDWFSQRDQRIGQIVDQLLSGEDVNVQEEIAAVRRDEHEGDGGAQGGENGDTDMMDLDRQETGGAGADATGSDARDEGEQSREGGADGGRAASSYTGETSAIVQNFLDSLKGSSAGSGAQRGLSDTPSTTLPDLLSTSTTVSHIDSASPAQLDHLCTLLPPELFTLAQEGASSTSSSETSPAAAQAAIEALSTDQKKEILLRVLRSPQLQQSLGSLTVALRDGGLPMIGEALGLKVPNGGLIRGGSVPLGGGEAVEAFIDGVKKTVEDEEKTAEGK